MDIDPIHVLYDNLVADITPIAFEGLCFEVIRGYAEFTALGVKHKAIIECKR